MLGQRSVGKGGKIIKNGVVYFVTDFDAIAFYLAGVQLDYGAYRITRENNVFRHRSGVFFDHADGGIGSDEQHIQRYFGVFHPHAGRTHRVDAEYHTIV